MSHPLHPLAKPVPANIITSKSTNQEATRPLRRTCNYSRRKDVNAISAGEDVLLLHCFMFCSTLWSLAKVSLKIFRIISQDKRGFIIIRKIVHLQHPCREYANQFRQDHRNEISVVQSYHPRVKGCICDKCT